MPPGANFTENELSILDDVDLNDTRDLLQNIPSNASMLFPDDIPCSSPLVSDINNRHQLRDQSPSIIENTPGNSPIHINSIENDCDITPVPSEYNSFAPSPTNFEFIESPAVATPASDINDITYSPSNIVNCRKRSSARKRDKGRLRERFEKKWKDQERKYNVNRGLEYVSRNGRNHDKRIMKPPCPTNCRSQNVFILFLITFRVAQNSRTLSISFNFVYTAIQKSENGNGFIELDQRGRHTNHPKTVDDDMVRSVIDHVEAFAPVPSHYTRQNSSKKYLEGSLSFPKMYKLYREWFDANEYASKVTSVRQYRDIINKYLNIGFHKPKKDVCEQCHIYENNNQITQTDKEKHEEHLREKEKARKMKMEDKDSALQNNEILTAAFDLQKCLNVPHGNVSTFYYKRKLSLYNFTVFNLGSRKGYCFSWHQQTARRGANEIASCVYKFIEETVVEGIKDYRFWSDNCGGQNRNRIVFLMYMLASSKFNIDISHRFLVVSHTPNEGDSMHALIERQTKDKLLYTPDQWYTAFRFAKSDENPYNVVEVSQELIKDFKSQIKSMSNWITTNDGSRMPWNKVTEIVVKASHPFKIFYKTSYRDDDYQWIDCLKKAKVTRNRKETHINIDNIPLAYDAPIPIDKNKHKDLMDLCMTLVIPREYHLFFNNLTATNSNVVVDDSDTD